MSVASLSATRFTAAYLRYEEGVLGPAVRPQHLLVEAPREPLQPRQVARGAGGLGVAGEPLLELERDEERLVVFARQGPQLAGALHGTIVPRSRGWRKGAGSRPGHHPAPRVGTAGAVDASRRAH